MNYGELTSNTIPDLIHKVVVLPIGSLEQHGHHLPMLTNSLIGEEIVRRAHAELGEAVLFLPMLWVGASDHHRGLPGAISASNDTYTHLLMDILDSLIGNGFRRIVLLNSHGGNGGPGGNAIYQIQLRHRDKPDLWLTMVSWFTIAGPQIAQIASLQQKHVTHACELETSMILRLRPELVKMGAAHGANIAFELGVLVGGFERSQPRYYRTNLRTDQPHRRARSPRNGDPGKRRRTLRGSHTRGSGLHPRVYYVEGISTGINITHR